MSSDQSSRRTIDEFLDRLPRLTLIVGKGGVGKTTCATATAAAFAVRGESVLLVATDPANSLGSSLGLSLEGGEPRSIDAGLWALQLDPHAARQTFLARWREVLVTIIDRGTYLDVEDIGGLVDAAFPGADEIFGLLVLAELTMPGARRATGTAWQRIVVDTAPTGHTLRLLALPETFEALIALLESMQEKHRFMVSALTHRYRRDAADEFLDEMRRAVGALRRSLGEISVGESGAGAVLVTRAEQVVVRETERYVDALRKLGVSQVAMVVEALPEHRDSAVAGLLEELATLAPTNGLFVVPRISPPPTGVQAASASLGMMLRPGHELGRRKRTIGEVAKRLERKSALGVPLKTGGDPAVGPDIASQLLRTLTIVGGKGGVGKTTVSCALALLATRDGSAGDILLVSTDPAPSLGDALGVATPRWAYDGPQPVTGLPGLHVWQMDATTAFHELRDRYRDKIDTLFDAFMGRTVDLSHDRAILRDLLSLAPPGIDELYALVSLGDALEAERYAMIIVDPAPTGHLLRLLELPTIAIEWSHRLMRLIMKYKEIGGLADSAQELLTFSRRTRALDALLHDQVRAGVVLVSLDEPAVTAETERLAELLRQTGIAVLGEVRNRAPYRAEANQHVVAAPEYEDKLVGIDAIREWAGRWRQPAHR